MTDIAPWVAVGAAVFLGLVAGVQGVRTWRAWRRAMRTRRAATALLDVHRAALIDSTTMATDATSQLSERSAQLNDDVAHLSQQVSHLRWLLQRIPESRAELRRAIADLLLPTRRSSAE